jgi:hypothetical protein
MIGLNGDIPFNGELTGQGGLGPGAGGLAFVLQNQGPDAMAGRGSAGGFAAGDGWRDRTKPGIPRSIAVFIDTYRNWDSLDPNDNYISICTNGPISKMRWPPRQLGIQRKLKVKMKDDRPHTARIVYKPPMMAVYLDEGEPEIRVPVDLSTVQDASGAAYAGFTAATGNGFQNHDILAWSFTSLHEEVSSAMFSVQSDIQYLTIEKAHGLVCGAEGECGGPEGSPFTKSGELVAPDRTPGALLIRTEGGRTWFSVNGRKGRGFRDNQGYFEFDVRLQ